MHINCYFFIAPRTKITLDARLAYRNKGDPDDAWKPYAASVVERILDCSIDDVNTVIIIALINANIHLFTSSYFA